MKSFLFVAFFAVLAGCSSSSSSASSTGDSAYRCADTGEDCTCYDPPPSGYDATACGSYGCCWTSSTLGQDGVTRKTCECTSDSVCIPPTNSSRVASCP